MPDSRNSLTSIFLALGANFLIAAAKFIAALITGSGAMLAEAVHSSADCGNQLLLIIGLKRSKREADDDHPLGYGMLIYFWSFIVAIILFSLGGLFSLFEGIEKFHNPHSVDSPIVALSVLGISIILESISLFGCLRQVNTTRGDQSIFTWFRESRQSELLVVFGEDIAALFGLTVAIISVTLTVITGNALFDAAGTVIIGIILITVAICVGYEVINLLIGQSADLATRSAISNFLAEREEIKRLINIITLQMGPQILVSVKAEMRTAKTAEAMVQDINRCEKAMKEKFPKVRWSFFEPDIK